MEPVRCSWPLMLVGQRTRRLAVCDGPSLAMVEQAVVRCGQAGRGSFGRTVDVRSLEDQGLCQVGEAATLATSPVSDAAYVRIRFGQLSHSDSGERHPSKRSCGIAVTVRLEDRESAISNGISNHRDQLSGCDACRANGRIPPAEGCLPRRRRPTTQAEGPSGFD
jgi:hypothetical protein